MRITSKGQVTIPAEIREQAGLLPHTEVDFEFDGKAVRIVRAHTRKNDGRGSRLIAQLRGRARRSLTGRMERETAWLAGLRSRPALASPVREIERRQELITGLTEHDSVPWEALPGLMERPAGHEWRLADRPSRLACSYTLQAAK